MSREIKFRFWQRSTQTMQKWEDYIQYGIFEMFKNSDSIPMQFTGLKDKNGREIHEGDVVKHTKGLWVGENDVIIFDTGMFHVSNTTVDLEFCVEHKGLKIIGNIYENPELLNPL